MWQNLLAGFWLVPGAVATVIGASAFLFIQIDRTGKRRVGFGFDGDAGAARDILSTIAGSLITVAGLTFSLTIVVLTLISSEFTPRALRGFLGDRLNQVVAGAFVGIFLYCLLVLRSVRGGGDGEAFVPALSVTVAIALGLLTLVLLLLFIHHMGQSIQASHIAARVGQQTLASIDRLYPERYGASPEEEDADEIVRSWLADGKPASVTPARAGYVLLVDVDSALKAAPSGARLQVAVRPGDFVTEDDALVRMWPADALEEARAPLRRSIPVEDERDLHQDVSYGLRQLTDIALKALSPGINDPTTAVTCIGYLRAALGRLAGRAIPAAVRRLDDAALVAETRSFEEYADGAFSEIGRYASDNARVVLVLLAAVRSVGCAARSAGAVERVPVLAEIGEAIAAPAIEGADATRDERLIGRELGRLREAFSASSAVGGGHEHDVDSA